MSKILIGFVSFATLIITLGIFFFILAYACPKWSTDFYTSHFNAVISVDQLKHNMILLASCLFVGGFIILLIIELLSKHYWDKREKHRFIIEHLKDQLKS